MSCVLIKTLTTEVEKSRFICLARFSISSLNSVTLTFVFKKFLRDRLYIMKEVPEETVSDSSSHFKLNASGAG